MITAYNQDVQRYIANAKSTKLRKETIIDIIKDSVLNAGRSFEKLFPSGSKRKAVLDEIIFYLSGKGICKVAAKTLAANTQVSIRTVSDTVKNLKATSEILVAGLADGKNKYVFVLKSHPNFKEILKKVFFINELPNEENIDKNSNNAEQNVKHIAEQENFETVDTVRGDEENPSFNHFNFFNLKQAQINIIRDLIESEIKNIFSDKKETEFLNTYYTNQYQYQIYYFIKNGGFHDQIKDNALLIGLRTGSNANKISCLMARDSLKQLDKYLKNGGTIRTSISATFSSIYTKMLKERATQTTKSDVNIQNKSRQDLNELGVF